MKRYLKNILIATSLVALPAVANAQIVGIEARESATRITIEPDGRANATASCVVGEKAIGGVFNLQPLLNSGNSTANLGDASIDVVRTFVNTSANGRNFQVTARMTPNANGPVTALVRVTVFCVPEFFTFDVEPADKDDVEELEDRIDQLEEFIGIFFGETPIE